MNNQWFTSSTGSGDLSLTIKGLIATVVPFGLAELAKHGVVIADADVNTFLTNVAGVISAVMVIYGLLRKVDVSLRKPTPPQQ